jgi:hypothetical protein
LALYHNEYSWIDENGKPLKRKTKFFEHRLTRTIYVSNPRKSTQSIKLFVSGKYADSALAFRRSFIEADLHHLANCYLSIDALLLDLALASSFGILYDNKRLTYLRLNKGSVTNTPGVNPKFKLTELEILTALTKKNWSPFDTVSTEIARLKVNLISAGYINGRVTVKDFFHHHSNLFFGLTKRERKPFLFLMKTFKFLKKLNTSVVGSTGLSPNQNRGAHHLRLIRTPSTRLKNNIVARRRVMKSENRYT